MNFFISCSASNSDFVDIDIDGDGYFNNFDFEDTDHPVLRGIINTPPFASTQPSTAPSGTGPFDFQPPSYADVCEGYYLQFTHVTFQHIFIFSPNAYHFFLIFVGRGFERLSQLFAQNANVTVPNVPIDLTTSGTSMPLHSTVVAAHVNPPPSIHLLGESSQAKGTLIQGIPPAHLHPLPGFHSVNSSNPHLATSASVIPPAHVKPPPGFCQVTPSVPPATSAALSQHTSAPGFQGSSVTAPQENSAEQNIIPPLDSQTKTSEVSTSFPTPPPPADVFSDASIPDAMLIAAESQIMNSGQGIANSASVESNTDRIAPSVECNTAGIAASMQSASGGVVQPTHSNSSQIGPPGNPVQDQHSSLGAPEASSPSQPDEEDVLAIAHR